MALATKDVRPQSLGGRTKKEERGKPAGSNRRSFVAGFVSVLVTFRSASFKKSPSY